MYCRFDMGWFKHDDGFRNEPAVRYLRSMQGNDGYAVFLYLLEMLNSSQGNSIILGDIEKKVLSSDFGVTIDKIESIVGVCCEVELLTLNDGTLSCEMLDKIIKTNSERARDAVISRWDKGKETGKREATKSNKNVRQKKNPTDAETVKAIVSLWNETCTSLPKVSSINEGRAKKVKSRIEEWGGDETAVDFARQVFEACQSSDFLTGRNGDWKASFDWIMENPTNWVKVMEGNYKNNENEKRGAGDNKSVGGKVGYSDIGKAVELGFALTRGSGGQGVR